MLQPSLSIALLRMLMGLVFMAHATIRLVDYSLPGFGEFLNSKGFPGGFYLAWIVTIFELLGGLLMVMRKFVKLFCAIEVLILLTGIVIVHSSAGWFVVGKTLGGMEYSVVLIIVLTAIFLAEWKEERNIRPVL
ncbi:MAG TPA: DoxX family protein [Chitinophagaceae bacterium]|nr:DoxX family protein [Chitinophagaceae bacterium]